MPSSTHVVTERDGTTNVTLSLTGQDVSSAEYRDLTSGLASAQTMSFALTVGPSSSKSNDRFSAKLMRPVTDANGIQYVGSVEVKLSTPRTTVWTGTDTDDLLAFIASLLTQAKRDLIGDYVIP